MDLRKKKKMAPTCNTLLQPSSKDNEVTGYLSIATDISYIKKTEKRNSILNTKDQNERLKNFAHHHLNFILEILR
jgi:hypothetical protein